MKNPEKNTQDTTDHSQTSKLGKALTRMSSIGSRLSSGRQNNAFNSAQNSRLERRLQTVADVNSLAKGLNKSVGTSIALTQALRPSAKIGGKAGEHAPKVSAIWISELYSGSKNSRDRGINVGELPDLVIDGKTIPVDSIHTRYALKEDSTVESEILVNHPTNAGEQISGIDSNDALMDVLSRQIKISIDGSGNISTAVNTMDVSGHKPVASEAGDIHDFMTGVNTTLENELSGMQTQQSYGRTV